MIEQPNDRCPICEGAPAHQAPRLALEGFQVSRLLTLTCSQCGWHWTSPPVRAELAQAEADLDALERTERAEAEHQS